MELWIRSQNKYILQKTNALFISHSEENIWSIIDNQNMTKYGEYKTLERALEILDEIQNILKPKILAHIRPSEEMEELLGGLRIGKTMKMKKEFEFKELLTYVYEMPKE